MTSPAPVNANRYAVYGPDTDEPLVIDAENWVFALGTALELLERADWVSRLACEVHPDGTVLAEDRVTGARYVVHRIPYAPSETTTVRDRVATSERQTARETSPAV